MSATLDGMDAHELATVAAAPRAWVYESIGSTMDEAHRLAGEGALSGAIVIADVQRAGRGRLGRTWSSPAGHGLWITAIHRGVDTRALDCLAIRVGLELARVLDHFSRERVRIKWPNDLYLSSGKLGGILVEVRWRDQALEWVAVGVGINLQRPADQAGAAALVAGTSRRAALAAVAPAIRAACAAVGELSAGELAAFGERDAVRNTEIVQPVRGLARGISANGALLVDTPAGRAVYRSGSLVIASEAT